MCSARSFAAVALLLSGPVATQDWPVFRGPSCQGIARGTPLPPRPTEQHVRWRVAVGAGHSSPVVVGERLYLTRMAAEPDKREVVCLDASTGAQRWAAPCAFQAHRQHRFNSSASATPAADAEGVCVVWSSGAALEARAFHADGKPNWHRRLGGFAAQHGSGASPILCAGLLVVANDNASDDSFLVALDRATGKERWRVKRKKADSSTAYSCPVVVGSGPRAPYLLFASTTHGLTAVAPQSGAVLWELDLALKHRCVATPCLIGDTLFVSAGSGGGGKDAVLVRLPALPDQQPKLQQRLRKVLPYVPCALAGAGEVLWVTDGGVACRVSVADGAVRWQQRLGGSFFSSPVTDGKTVFVADRAGVLHSFPFAGREPEMARFDLGSPVFATPAIAHGRLYVRTAKELVCLGAAPRKARKL
ncbi:MAG: PQQ-binding-like beta-propeller repeat protein [Planctomycetes bacterium]|nr:PQQ-binding-like beta-propeller repeat protein [Planctomycetota bacterium]